MALRLGIKGLSAAFCATLMSTAATIPATAQSTFLDALLPDQPLVNSGIMGIIFVGGFSFAMFAATWLIRERRTLEDSNRNMALEIADLKARHDRAQALLDVPDQRVVIWESRTEMPVCKGTLPASTGAPSDVSDFIAFGRWMIPQSAQDFERAVDRLRDKAEGFDLSIETKNGSLIEVQGRASGSHAFVRFISLSGDRAALAALESDHTHLVQTTETMRSLLEKLPMPVWLRGKSGDLTWANAAYVEALEAKSLDDAIDQNLDLIDTERRNEISTEMQDRSTETIASFHSRFPVTIAGDRRMTDVTMVTFDEGSAGLAADVSEIEEVQTNLRRTIESHTQTINQLATAVAIFDEKRQLIFHNQAFENLWQIEKGILNSNPTNSELFEKLREAGQLAEQPDWTKWRDGLMEVYEATQPQENWWHLPDGRTLRVVANPHKQGGVTWVFENITEQLEMESRYIALTQVQGETLDHLSEAIAVFASDGRLKLSNPSFQKLWNLEDEEVAAETPIKNIANLCRDEVAEREVWDVLVTGVTGVSDKRDTLSGRLELLSESVLDYALVPLPNGQTMLSFADVTAAVNLEHTLVERNEALEAAERLKNAFIEHVSYEFRAPLTNIKGFAEILEQQAFGPLNDKQAEYVHDIATSSNILHALVNNLLDLATVDAGIMELDLQEVEANTIMNSAKISVQEHLQDKNVFLQVIETDVSAKFVADPARVEQVLFNLLHNAISFSPSGSTVTLESAIEPDGVSLRVSDPGPGIPAEERDTIFDRFASSATKGAHRGAGLGLSIARSLVELHGGTIKLDTTVKGGASFVCTFPRLPVAETTPAAQAAQ